MIAAGLESLLFFLVLIVISGLSTWLQKRRQAGEDQAEWEPGEGPGRTPPRPHGAPQAPPAGPRRPMPAPLQNWEEELRRLLEGDRYQPPEPPPQAAPPPLPTVSSQRPSAPGPAAPRRTVVSAHRSVEVEGPRTSRLEESEQAYRHAQRLQVEAAERLRKAQAKTARHRTVRGRVEHPTRGSDILAARALLSKPRLARRAIIASVILGQPKGYEQAGSDRIL